MSSAQPADQRNPLRAWRRKKGISQAELAELLGVHHTNVSQWEQGRCSPSLETFQQLVDRTGIPMRPLLRFLTSRGLAAGTQDARKLSRR